jgi:diguanylate cyclase (GGDEF)-like protein
MGSEAPVSQARGYRPPWLWLPVLAVAALVVTFLVVSNARTRIAQNDAQFHSGQQVRLHEMETRIDDYFGKAIQLVATGSQTLANVRNDHQKAETLVNELFLSRSTREIHDVGVSYEPYAFTPDARYYCVFVFETPTGVRMGLYTPHGTPYTKSHWYRRALETPNVPRFDGPYVEGGGSYISTVQAFTRDGLIAGVMSVDTRTSTFVAQNMTAMLDKGDIAWIESSGRGRKLLETAPFPQHGDLIDESISLRYTQAFIHLSSDASALHGENAQIFTMSTLLIVALWLGAAGLGLALLQIWRSRGRAAVLEDERARLESEIAVGKRVEAELRKAAYTDALTGLPNRAALMESASEAILETATGVRYALFFIDLDRFNMINETMGHLAGDELLKMIAARLHEDVAGQGMIARLGGDEFVVLARVEPSRATTMAEGFLSTLHLPMLLGGRLIYSSASIGLVVVDAAYKAPEELLRDADIAMYEAKRRGRACFAVFDTAMRSRVASESDLENDLRRAIERHEFVPYYQPIFDTQSETIVSFEALVRWHRPGSGVVGAADFITYAERSGLIDTIDTSVLEDVCRDAGALFACFPNATVAVNVSAAHLAVPNLADTIGAVLRANGVPAPKLKLEITETAIMHNAEQARTTLEALRRNGIQIVLDDFGAGQSSLGYLHRLPIAGLKIDRSFVAPLPGDANAVAIVRSVVALAHAIGLYTVAEGVETAEQLEALRQLGVENAQGFLFSPAVSLENVLAGLRRTTA